ncbi:MAG: SulP family inorganic anion transporter [Oceanipulchritudo sp.]
MKPGGVPLNPRQDLMAGLTVALIALPLALALGVASIPIGTETPMPAPATGVFTAILGGFLVSLLGGSRVQIGGPTAAFIPIVILIIMNHGYMGLLVATVMAGVILVVMGVARMGVLIKYIPWPVTSGFTTGIAVAIMLGQIPDALGLSAETARPREFLERIEWIAAHIGTANPLSMLLAGTAIVVILAWSRLKITRVPGSVAALILTTLAVAVFGLDELGVMTIAGRFGEGALAFGWPVPSLPQVELAMLRDLIGPATAIALLGAIESLLSAVVADGLSGDRHDSNTELIAQGISNILCPFFGGLPVTGAVARTSANIASGARSPLAGVTAAFIILAIALAAGPLVGKVPLAGVAAVLIGVGLRMGDWHELQRLLRMPHSDAVVLVTTLGLTVAFDLVIAVEVGMVLAAILFIKRVSETTEVARVHPNDELIRPENIILGRQIPDGAVIYRIFGPFLFGAAEKMEDALSRIDALPRVLILEMHLVTAMDLTGMNALESVVERLHRAGGHVVISGIHHQPLQMLRKAGFIPVIGRENFCATLEDSLKRAEELT